MRSSSLPTWSLNQTRARLQTAPTNPDSICHSPPNGALAAKMRIAVHAPYPNFSAALATAGGLVFTGLGDGTFIAYDDVTLEALWKINLGSGFNAPPMTFEVGGKQYVAILSGLSQFSKARLGLTPELREMRNQTMLFVFGL